MSELNANKVLYDALCSSLDYYERLSSNALTSTNSQTETEALKGYSREAVHVGRLLKRDMDKAGISLAEKERTRIMNLHSTIYSAGTAFSELSCECNSAKKHKIKASLILGNWLLKLISSWCCGKYILILSRYILLWGAALLVTVLRHSIIVSNIYLWSRIHFRFVMYSVNDSWFI